MNLTQRQMTAPAFTLPRHLGQGKRAATILACEGDIVTVITDTPYNIRKKHPIVPFYKGARAMHATTLRIPTQSYTNYQTTSQRFHSGRKDLAPVERRSLSCSQQMSQIKFGKDDSNHWETKYTWDYHDKPRPHPAVIHYPAFNNKMNMNEGKGMKKSLDTVDKQGSGTTFTQYNRIHNRLGAALGPGVSRPYPVRQQYDLLTGEEKGPAWQADNARVSGNRVLYNGSRRDANDSFVLG